MEQNAIEVPKGLAGVIVDSTAISSTDNEGNLIYRGYAATEIAEKLSYDQAAYLIVYSSIPTPEQLGLFSKFISDNSNIDSSTEKIIKLMPKGMPLIDILRSVVSMLPTKETENDRLLLSISAKMPRIISNSYRCQSGLRQLKDIKGNSAERFYYLLTGKKDKVLSRYFEKMLILYMEHEFNASTFALRVTASTLADPKAAVTSGLAAIKGPLHGGANAEILNYMLSMKSADEARSFIDQKLSKREKIMGFGHRIYKKMDPRAQFIKGQLKQLAKLKNSELLYEIAVAAEDEMWEKKQIPANLDFYAAIYMYLLGISEPFYTPIFAASRSFGWAAHYIEQVGNNKLIRPDSKYSGPTNLSVGR